jgi:esterase/lipase superfamily enzyme
MGSKYYRGKKGPGVVRALIWLTLATSLAAATMGGPARAQGSDELDALNSQIAKLYSDGKYAEATPLAEHYVDLARQRYGEEHPEFATAITWLGSLYQSEGRHDDAEPLLKRALSIREKELGPDHALVGTSLSNLAALYESQGRDADAEPLLKRALSIREKAQGSDELDALKRHVEELDWNGKEDEAIPLAERYVTLTGQRYGEKHPEFVSAITSLGSLYESQHRYDEAETLLKRALSIREKELGPDDLQVSDSLDALAALYESQQRYDEAEVLLKRALSIREKGLGPDALQVSYSLDALARLYESEGRITEAEELHRRARAIRAKSPGPPEYAAALEPSYAVVKVYYATDRKKTSDADRDKIYGGDRSELAFGICTVSIPRDHRMGELEAPSVWRLEWSEDPEHHVVLLSVTEKERSAFYQEVVGRMRQSAGKNALIFVHGYNVTFADAARRTAQLAYDLAFDGVPVFYSWPSQGSFESYMKDGTNAEWSEADLVAFLKDFVEQSEAENIFLIAHSMGARVLTGALKELFVEYPAIRQKLKGIILAAPDIDADTFKRDIAPRILTSERIATLYASSHDNALKASKEFAGYRRAGDTAGGVTLAEGLDTIDASKVQTDFLGHSYFAESGSVLGDVRNIMLYRKHAEERSGLTPVESAAGRYWAFSR